MKKGIWNISQFRDLALAHRYSLNDVDDLELLLLHNIVDAADLQARKDAQAKAKAEADAARAAKQLAAAQRAAAEAETHGVSIARYETLVVDGIKTVADYSAFLASKGISQANAAAFVQQLQLRLARKAAQPGQTEGPTAAAKAKGLSIGQLERAVKYGHMSLAEYNTRLISAGIPAADVAILVEVLQDDLDHAATKAAAIEAAHAAAAVKGLSLSQEQLAARQGLITLEQYRAWLGQHGYQDPDLALLVAEMQNIIARDKAARETKAGESPLPVEKGLSLAQLEKAVRAGAATLQEYTDALVKAGYDHQAQQSLAGLLQLRLDQDQRTAVLRGQADGLLSPKGLSLRDVERAVKAKVLPMGAYTDLLQRAGVPGGDIQTLALTLAAGIKNVTPKPATVPSITALLASKGLSLSRLESDVLAGRLTLQAFSTILAGAGVPGELLAELVPVLQLQLDQRAAARELAGDAQTRATTRNLSLAEEVKAIKYGYQTVEDYAALAQKLGYDQVAVQILVAMLQDDLAYYFNPETL